MGFVVVVVIGVLKDDDEGEGVDTVENVRNHDGKYSFCGKEIVLIDHNDAIDTERFLRLPRLLFPDTTDDVENDDDEYELVDTIEELIVRVVDSLHKPVL